MNFENLITKIWCKLPKCWHYKHHTEDASYHILYIWFIWRKFDVFRFKHPPFDAQAEYQKLCALLDKD